MIEKIGRLAALSALGAGLVLGAAGCGGVRYEDCEVSDQEAREPDCGYYELAGRYSLTPLGIGETWHWWSWVVVGQSSFAPADWKPPHGLKPPIESKASKDRRKSYEKRQENLRKKQNQAPVGTKNGNGQPRTGSGNQGIPKNNPAPPPRVNNPAPRPRR